MFNEQQFQRIYREPKLGHRQKSFANLLIIAGAAGSTARPARGRAPCPRTRSPLRSASPAPSALRLRRCSDFHLPRGTHGWAHGC